MTVFSRGYAEAASSDSEEACSTFIENLDLIRSSEQKILEMAEYFFCELPFSRCSWPYVGGDGPLCLGHLLLGWRDGILIEPCPDCDGECLSYSFAGSPLPGSNSWSGFCTLCKTRKHNRDSVHKPFYTKVQFICHCENDFLNGQVGGRKSKA
jgi:hypothetical protein